ncbi:MAG: cupin domain-containing protein [Sedimentisphaerales bacterium]|nr:cupin domain-containing protein [Sedimentisphaerales bacterium]
MKHMMDKDKTQSGLGAELPEYLNRVEVQRYRLADDGTFPNNSILPLLVYPAVVRPYGDNVAGLFESLFIGNGWDGNWVNGIYDFHHYHSRAHEVLGVFSGSAQVQLGGPNGFVTEVHAGDVVVIPAGVAHKNLGSSRDFGVVGGYPNRQRPDMCYGRSGDRPAVDERIAVVGLPATDPVYGENGPLVQIWQKPD